MEGEHVDADIAITEEEFAALSVEQKVETLTALFGPEGAQPEHQAQPVPPAINKPYPS